MPTEHRSRPTQKPGENCRWTGTWGILDLGSWISLWEMGYGLTHYWLAWSKRDCQSRPGKLSQCQLISKEKDFPKQVPTALPSCTLLSPLKSRIFFPSQAGGKCWMIALHCKCPVPRGTRPSEIVKALNPGAGMLAFITLGMRFKAKEVPCPLAARDLKFSF